MSLEIRINEDIKQAMREKNKLELESLRAVKAALLLIKTGKDYMDDDIPESLEVSTVQKLIKQRKEAADVYKVQNRLDLLEEEVAQIVILQRYLPEQMTDEEVKNSIEKIIEREKPEGIKDLGKVMRIASSELAGKTDNKVLSELVKKLLTQ